MLCPLCPCTGRRALNDFVFYGVEILRFISNTECRFHPLYKQIIYTVLSIIRAICARQETNFESRLIYKNQLFTFNITVQIFAAGPSNTTLYFCIIIYFNLFSLANSI